MIRLTVVPRSRSDLYRLLIDKELELRRRKMCTLHRSGAKKRGQEKWRHTTYPGWINLQRGDAGTLAAVIHSKATDDEWKLLRSVIGFLDRHFRREISSITISYD